jgi:hypothetical protein
LSVRNRIIICLVLVSLQFSGLICAQDTATTDAKKIQVPPAQAAIVGKGEELEQTEKRKGKGNRGGKKGRAAESTTSGNANSSPGRFDERRAADQLLLEVRDCLALRRTLVVWLVEQSSDSSKLAANMAAQIDRICSELKNVPSGKLEMAVVGYGENVNLLTSEPVGDLSQLSSAIAALKDKSAEAGKPVKLFHAVNQVVEKFLPYRQRGYEVLFIVIGTSPGDDQEAADKSIAALRRAAVSVYGVAPAVPFSPFTASNRNQKSAPQTSATDKRPVESLQPERIQLALSGNQNAADLSDSGFGPFGIERLCRQTGGRLLRLRGGVPSGWNVDSSAGDVRWDLLAKYAPDYVSPEQYTALLAENKCRQALHDAALLPPTQGLSSPETNFPKQKDEAALARVITTAQRVAADRDQPLQRLYDALSAGESARPALTGARWQAAYDLAMGQTLAAKARLDGYNAMLALIKQGKSFANESSTRWILEPADEVSAGSAMDKMAKNSRIYLQRVVKEHPGTPWAAIAERELRHPAGWKFVEK